MATIVSSKKKSKSRVEKLDHATIPSIDLLADLEFYEIFFGADLVPRTPGTRRIRAESGPMVNLAVGPQKQIRAPIFFMEMANMQAWGLFFQADYPPKSSRMLEGPRHGFTVEGDSLDEAAKILDENDIEFMGPVRHEVEHPIAESIYFKDLSDNNLELCTWRGKAQGPAAAKDHTAGADHARYDVSFPLDDEDMERAEDFYVTALGIERLYRGEAPAGVPTSVLQFPSGQILPLQLTDPLSERNRWAMCGNGHVAFLMEMKRWDMMMAEMDKRGVELLPNLCLPRPHRRQKHLRRGPRHEFGSGLHPLIGVEPARSFILRP